MNTQEGFSKVMIGQQGKCKSNYEMFTTAVFVFTHLPEARLQIKLDSDKWNYERICLNKEKIFLNLGFRQVDQKRWQYEFESLQWIQHAMKTKKYCF